MKQTLATLAVLLLAATPTLAGEKIGTTKAGAALYTYDAPTNKDEVFETLRTIVRNDALSGNKRLIFVITGTHGAADGTVTSACAEVAFKEEDLDSAKITRDNINIRVYQDTAPNRWKELSDKGQNCVLVLAWCFSHQWISNTTADGNNSKIVMK